MDTKKVIVGHALSTTTYRMNRTVAEVEIDEIAADEKDAFTFSNIGYNATVLDAALKDTECPVSVGELLDLVTNGMSFQWEAGSPNDHEDELLSWVAHIMDEIDTGE